MNKLVLSSLMVGFVFGAGLVSCSQEVKTQDVYRASPPVIRSETAQTNLKAWDERANRDLDLHDVVDVSASRASQISVTSKCRINGIYLDREVTRKNPTQIPIWQLIHEDLLVQQQVSGAICGFTFILSNAAGSTHIFQINSAGLIENRTSPVQLDPDEVLPKENLPRYSPLQKNVLRLRYANGNVAKANLICPELKALPVHFENMMTLSAFDIRKPTSERARTRIQTCRVMISELGNPIALSSLIQIEPPDYIPLQVHIRPYLKSGEVKPGGDAIDVFLNRPSVRRALAEVQITNPEKYPRKIKFVGQLHAVQVDMLLAPVVGQPNRPLRFLKNAYVITTLGSSKPVENLNLSAGQTIRLEIVFLSAPLICELGIRELSLTSIQPWIIQDLSLQDEVLSQVEYSAPDFSWSQVSNARYGPPISRPCIWPDLP